MTSTRHLPYTAPLDWAGFREFLGARALAGVEEFEGDTYRRSFALDGAEGTLSVTPRPAEDALELVVNGGSAEVVDGVARRVRRLFDLDADPAAIASTLSRDPRLRRALAARPGLRVPGAFEPFETAVRAILGQQISVAAATTLAARLVHRFGRPLPAATARGAITHLAPDAAALARADFSRFGVPQRRADAIQSFAREMDSGRLRLGPAERVESTVERLLELPGFGPWTAHYVAMRACGERDAFPAGDLGVRRALGKAGELARDAESERHSQRWRPYRAYAVMHLWMTPP
jgi:3-methyladenine DNA glycosylase/8-oxoguanine DNA glycosylase